MMEDMRRSQYESTQTRRHGYYDRGSERERDKLQEESWNLELLISGFSIFGLFKAKEFLEDKRALLFASDIGNSSFMDMFRVFFEMVYASVFIFIIFLLLHLRGWRYEKAKQGEGTKGAYTFKRIRFPARS